MYDAWTDFFDMNRWYDAFEATGIDIDFYNLRERDTSEILPWDFIDIGVSKKFMIR